MAKRGRGFKITNDMLTAGLVIVGLGAGAVYLYQNPDVLNAALGRPTQAQQLAAGVGAVDQDMELEEAEALGMYPPYGPTKPGQIQTIPAIGGSGALPSGSIGGPINSPMLGIGGPSIGFGGSMPGRCQFRPADLVEATAQVARQYIRVLDFPITPLTNTIPRLQSCYYREIANYVNAGPTNPTYFAVEQVACAISSGQPFPVINSKSLIAAQVAKRYVNQGNCYNATMAPVPKRFDPVPILGVKRARAFAARRAARQDPFARSRARLYNYYARGGD